MTALNSQDAERLETLKVLMDTAGDDLEAALEASLTAHRKANTARVLFAQRRRDYESLRDALAGMAVKA